MLYIYKVLSYSWSALTKLRLVIPQNAHQNRGDFLSPHSIFIVIYQRLGIQHFAHHFPEFSDSTHIPKHVIHYPRKRGCLAECCIRSPLVWWHLDWGSARMSGAIPSTP